VYHGPKGLQSIANKIHQSTVALASKLNELGFKVITRQYFDTITIDLNGKTSKANLEQIALNHQVNLRYVNDSTVSISLDETTSETDLNQLAEIFAKAAGTSVAKFQTTKESNIDAAHLKTEAIIQQHIFNRYHSETEMMRYIKKLENKDLALNHSMISLGSCTMKLNAASELMPLSLPGFAQIHPFVPVNQAEGYHEMFDWLNDALCKSTGFAAMSLQPNSGAQGEYAGLMTIRAYHQSRGDFHRNISLIPSSAHGTNPASAVMAGMEVVVTKCDENGNVDIEDLRNKAIQYKDRLSCLMVTYPSTHGVFEEGIITITDIIHENGGLVYMDGANMNAQVGLTSPGNIGADVCHLNLHKTFAIPHGGGGPGMGPIGVNEKLKPFLPGHSLIKTGGTHAISAVSATPFGSSLILLVSYAYIRMLGGEGITNATKFAIFNANYLRALLEPHYPILYKGEHGFVAHEMILDCREFKKTAQIEVADIAKRLMDYGYHAPTVSFPVPGTIMVEPTESEGLQELDRFAEAMIAIRNEIAEVETGLAKAENNVIVNAPHTAVSVMTDDWNKPYSRQKAAFPLSWVSENKFWPSVGKIDNAYGDRNLVCSCEPMESYMLEEAKS
jgi:glycine dehydrogenase